MRVWVGSSDTDWRAAYTCGNVVRKHKAEVTDLSLHPLGDYFLTASRDKTWALHDLASGRVVRHVNSHEHGFGAMKFHPDGLLVASASEDKMVNVWDVKEQKIVASLPGHEAEVESLCFSENGYYLATASGDGVVKLWDLRKAKPLNFQSLAGDGPVNAVRFDATGQYLAVASNSVQVFNFATKSSLASTCDLKDHQGPVMGVCWGMHARSLSTVSMDRAMKIYQIK